MSGARSGRYLPGTAPARTGDGLRGVYGRSAKRAPYLPRHGALPWPLATVYAASTGAVSAERGAGAHKTPLGTAPARTGDGLRGVYGRRSLALDGMAQWRRTDALQSVPILATDTGRPAMVIVLCIVAIALALFVLFVTRHNRRVRREYAEQRRERAERWADPKLLQKDMDSTDPETADAAEQQFEKTARLDVRFGTLCPACEEGRLTLIDTDDGTRYGCTLIDDQRCDYMRTVGTRDKYDRPARQPCVECGLTMPMDRHIRAITCSGDCERTRRAALAEQERTGEGDRTAGRSPEARDAQRRRGLRMREQLIADGRCVDCGDAAGDAADGERCGVHAELHRVLQAVRGEGDEPFTNEAA